MAKNSGGQSSEKAKKKKPAQYLNEAASMILDTTTSQYFKGIIDEIENNE